MAFLKGRTVVRENASVAGGAVPIGHVIALLSLYVYGQAPFNLPRPAQANVFRNLAQYGLITEVGDDLGYEITQKGLLYIAMLKEVPFPKKQEVWVNPLTGAQLVVKGTKPTSEDDDF